MLDEMSVTDAETKSASAAGEPARRFTGIDRETPFGNDPSFVFFGGLIAAEATASGSTTRRL